MPIDQAKFKETLIKMKEIYDQDPTISVRSKAFIKVLDEYCVYELERLGIKDKVCPIGIGDGTRKKKTTITVKQETSLIGKHRPKDVDVCVYTKESGPIIAISTRSQMSSVGKNIINYYEGIIGDVINLHENFPSLVIGEIYLLPTEPIKKKADGTIMKETINFATIEHMFSLITERENKDSPPDKYEHFAFLVVDFTKNPPELHQTFPSSDKLKIDNFFDKLLKTHNERSPFLKIDS